MPCMGNLLILLCRGICLARLIYYNLGILYLYSLLFVSKLRETTASTWRPDLSRLAPSIGSGAI